MNNSKILSVTAELANFDKDGKSLEYVKLTCIINGISIRLVPVDNTSKEICKQFIKGEIK